MTDNLTTRYEDRVSVGSRISWGAIVAGFMISLGIYFLLTSLGAAVGLSISERVKPKTLEVTAIVWAFLVTTASLFVGGLVTSLLTSGEDKWEAVLYGTVMWAMLFSTLMILTAAGFYSGFHSMAAISRGQQNATTANWEDGAREAGVPVAQIEDWRRKAGAVPTPTGQQPEDKETKEAATRLAWYAFGGTWLSMIAAALGALLGAGPTFRVVGGVRTPQRVQVG